MEEDLEMYEEKEARTSEPSESNKRRTFRHRKTMTNKNSRTGPYLANNIDVFFSNTGMMCEAVQKLRIVFP